MRWAGLLLLVGCKQIFGLEDPVPVDGTPCAARDVAVGYQHSCMIDSTGAVLCWGGNDSGQANPGLSDDVVVSPTEVVLPGPAISVGAGRHFSCALLETGEVWCWGDNTHGQFGDGTYNGGAPTRVPGLIARSISVGARTVCARRDDDLTLLCWGDSRQGQAGFSEANSPDPRTLTGTAGTLDVRAGHAHTCAVAINGLVTCWGRGTSQQLGAGTSSTPNPVLVDLLGTTVVELTASARSSCAVTDGHELICWGSNAEGQLALGTFDSPKPPTMVALPDVVEADLGVSGGCARHGDGRVSCWGILRPGDGTWATSSSPRQTLVQGATKLAHGFFHACAIVDGVVQCWGLNDNAELGRGGSSIQLTPTPVALSPEHVAVGDEHVCTSAKAEVRCWGHNERGQLGNGSSDGSASPVTVTLGLGDLLGIAASARSTCAYTSSSAKCWGDNRFGQLGAGASTNREVSPVALTYSGVISQISMGLQHACLVGGSEVRCWGNNNRGQLGIGSTTNANAPQFVSIPQPVEVTTGNFHSCARTSGSAVYCWGSNADGQLGDGTLTQRTSPVLISGAWSQVRAGSHHTCGITSAGAIQCWGRNDDGQLGIGSTVDRMTPQPVTNFPGTAVQLFGGGSTMCAVNNSGDTYCWGRNDFGQLGDGTRTNRLAPTRIVSASVLKELDIGILGGCRILADGAFDCWGVEALQATGSYDSATPMPVDGGSCPK